jgi:hypothetical protein
VLESVEHLLERELNAGENTPVAAGDAVGSCGSTRQWNEGTAGCKEQREMNDYQRKPDEAAHYTARGDHQPTQSDPPRTAWMNIRVEPDDDAIGVNRQHCRGNLSGIY